MKGFDGVRKCFNFKIWKFLLEFVCEMALKNELKANDYFAKLKRFPPKIVEFVLLRLLVSVENHINSSPQEHDKHKLTCQMIHSVCYFYFLLSRDTTEYVFEYMINLLYRYDDKQLVERILVTMAGLARCLNEEYQMDFNLLLRQNTSQLANEYAKMFIGRVNSEQKQPPPQQQQSLNWKAHTNWCRLLLGLNRIEHFDWSPNLFNLLHDYALSLINPVNCARSEESAEMVLWAILLLENIFFSRKSPTQKSVTLFERKLSALLEKVPPIGQFNLATANSTAHNCARYQVRWCAQWFLTNVHKRSEEELLKQKISIDGLSVRNDFYLIHLQFDQWSHQRPLMFCKTSSTVPVTLGAYFYEVTLVTDGEMRIGWVTSLPESDSFEEYWSGFLNFSNGIKIIGLDMFNRCIWNNMGYPEHELINYPQWHSGDVIGCLVDFDENKFIFYINGEEIDFCPELLYSHTGGYYPAVVLLHYQHCVFNFGGTPFRFPPDDVPINELMTGETDEAFTGQELISTQNNEHITEEADYVPKGQKLTYLRFNQMISELSRPKRNLTRNVEKLIVHDEILSKLEDIHPTELKSTQKLTPKSIKPFETIGFIPEDKDKIDVNVSKLNEFVSKKGRSNRSREKLCQAIEPYLEMPIGTQEDVPMHRDICIVLSSLILNCPNIPLDHKQVFAYLHRTFSATNEVWTEMYALIGLTELIQTKKWISEDNLLELRRSRKVSQLIAKLKSRYDNLNYSRWLNSSEEMKNMEIQLYLYVDKFNKTMHELNKNYWFVRTDRSNELIKSQITLHASDKSAYLQLSPDGMIARSDRTWQSVRSARSDILYFEVTLVTNGAMRIGWSTSNSNLNNAKVGDDMDSVGFDGYNRCVWHESIVHQFSNVPQWKAGDVISCKINKEKRTFTFTLNDCLIRLPYLNFSPLDYHVSVSLAPSQQCLFNFGQVTFRHANIRDWELYELLKKQIKPFHWSHQ